MLPQIANFTPGVGSVPSAPVSSSPTTPTSQTPTAPSPTGQKIASQIGEWRQKYPGQDDMILKGFIRDNPSLPITQKLQSSLGQGRVYVNNNPIAAAVKTGGTNEYTQALDQAGIKWSDGSPFPGNPSMSTIKIEGDPIAASKAILSASSSIQSWYGNHTGSSVLDQYGIKNNTDFKNASPQVQEAVIAGIKKNEAGSGGYTATQLLNSLVQDNQAPNPQSTNTNGKNADGSDQIVNDSPFAGIGNFAKGLIEPELKGGATAVRAVQATPDVLSGNVAGANATMAKPLFGQPTLEGSSVDQNLASAGNAGLQALGLKLPALADAYQGGGIKAVLDEATGQKLTGGLLQKLIKGGATATELYGLYKLLQNSPVKALTQGVGKLLQ